MHDGDDSSCLNLYQTRQPRVLGVPSTLAAEDRFDWAGTVNNGADSEHSQIAPSPWRLLENSFDDGSIPAVLDANTARYGLKIGLGDHLLVDDGQHQPASLRIVALLKNSILQGDVLISDHNFRQLYPDTTGQRLFLLRPTNDSSLAAEQVRTLLEDALSDYGFAAESARNRLARYLSVQNTYLSTFQSLGALGLLLGTLGLAAAQLRSVIERRGELALLRSTGFRRSRLVQLVMVENGLLIATGLVVGVAAAAVAVLPHWLLQSADIPWPTLLAMPLGVAAAGLAATWLATRRALRAPLLEALRGT